MVWVPANYDGSCNGNSSAPLTFVCFLIQYFGGSNDEILKNIYPAQNESENDFDFIIVGAGPAGCVVANRLSENSNWKVLLLETGDEEPLVTAVPNLSGDLQGSNIDYAYNISDLSYTYPRGKVMGGSTSINGMYYIRGSKADYDGWKSSGNEGWGWDDVLPYFKKSENARDPEILAKYANYHGTGGYLTVEQSPTMDKSTELFINAFEEAGLNKTDYNKGDQVGVGIRQYTSVHGTRLSGNGAFIRPIRGKRSNLFVRPNSRVVKIIIDEKTKRATGVAYETKNENGPVDVIVSAKKEVIISAGAIESPKLLMVSGIGPKDDLEKLNITVIKDLPVGKNLRDHLATSLELISNSSSVVASDQTLNAELFEWINTHEGSMVRYADVEAFSPTHFENQSGAADIQFSVGGRYQRDNTVGNFSITVVLVQPKSLGFIKLNSTDPFDSQPVITMNLLNVTQDIDVLAEGLKFARKVANSQILKNAGLKESTDPITGCEKIDSSSDDYLKCYVQNTAGTYAHAVGTCKMGPDTDKMAVVDSTLKVHGVSGLRVIDSSIMPNIVRGNTMAATYMIGEKGSDMIKKDYM